MTDIYAIKQESMSLTNIYRAKVTMANSTTGEIRVLIPSVLGTDSEIALSYVGRTPINNVWTVPSVGEIIVVGAEDSNFNNVFWIQTNIATGWLVPQTFRSVTGATDIPTASDNGKFVRIDTSTGTVQITINTSLALPVGGRIDFAWIGAATAVSFVGSGLTLKYTPGLKLRAQYSSATLVCLGTNDYLLVGDLSA